MCCYLPEVLLSGDVIYWRRYLVCYLSEVLLSGDVI